jgi:hypothetical protein
MRAWRFVRGEVDADTFLHLGFLSRPASRILAFRPLRSMARCDRLRCDRRGITRPRAVREAKTPPETGHTRLTSRFGARTLAVQPAGGKGADVGRSFEGRRNGEHGESTTAWRSSARSCGDQAAGGYNYPVTGLTKPTQLPQLPHLRRLDLEDRLLSATLHHI